ncbi:hypothetical protein [Streptomyces roseicoloratus]|uniref:Integral-membrane protein n=1 Tax=Streptomyces roseicoloratus TaxID=2508722 RepID=A0ABY9S0Q8_9ACTN|nr:hypothetical protein [Streptomyces roseicoloratus]WMX47416.1 hypothetical protein RGF97_24905 [Streptomyces roseicoloratus]
MTHPRSPLRALRAAFFAAVCVTLAAVGHSSLSAHPVPPSSLLAAFAVTAALAWAAAGRRRGPVAVAAGLAAVQGTLHLIFGAGEHGGPGGTVGSPSPELPAEVLADPYLTHAAQAAHAAHAAAHGGSHTAMAHAMDGAAAAAGSGAASGTGMLAAHVLAALACGLWLARGEAALFALARTVGARAWAPLRLLLAAVRILVPARPAVRRTVRPRRHTRPLHGVLLARSVSRRGPPRPPLTFRATALGALL